MKKFFTPLIFSLLILLTTGFVSSDYFKPAGGDADSEARTLLPVESTWVDSVLQTMNLNEKIGQLFMVSAYSNKGVHHQQHILELIKKYHIGGLIFFQGTPGKQAKLTNVYQNYAEIPLMIGMDAEWGLGMRLDSTIHYPRQMALGAIQNDSLIYRMGFDIGSQLRRLGVHINFAPVVDINNNPDNPVIGSRSFGEEREQVARKGIAYMNGMQDRRVLAVAKHFPGHGDTDQDSHKTLPLITHDSARLDSVELFPFRRLINNGVGGVMVAHLNIPALVESDQRPSTLSSQVITELLRNSLSFNGLVFTDALNMRGVTSSYEPGEIEFKALKAGNDVLLYPQDVPQAINYIKKQLRRGNITEESIDNHCRRILAFKYWAGLDSYKSRVKNDKQVVQTTHLLRDLNDPSYKALLQELRENSLVLLDNRQDVLPVKNLDTMKIAGLAMGMKEESKTVPFLSTMNLYGEIDSYVMRGSNEKDDLAEKLAGYDLVLAGMLGTHQYTSNTYGLNSRDYEFLDSLSKRTRVALVHFANPYGLKLLSKNHNLDALVVAFNDDSLTQHVAAQSLFGGIELRGKLPVSVQDHYDIGTGMEQTIAARLKYGLPESAGMSSDKLKRLDSLVHAAIEDKATPGCQVLVARKGRVVYHKAFGHHTYLRQNHVEWNDLYDIASLTKIVATLPVLMDYTNQHKISLDSTLDTYLPYLDTTNKGDLILKDILTHQSRLKSWIPFYQNTLEPLLPGRNLIDNDFSEEYPYKLGKYAYVVKNFRYKEGVFSRQKSEGYSVEVADGLFMNRAYVDSVFRQIDRSELRKKKDYKYSDLGYYYFYRMIEKMSGQPLEQLVNTNYYAPLGANRTGYMPLRQFPKQEIVPTENDMVFRRQLLDGYVHDPGTAMLGGVCGHAGVFSNANDLAKIMQMYLQGGHYGKKVFFSKETVNLFTDSPFKEKNGNRRGIGFDKPILEKDKPGPTSKNVSPKSFGHTGFTGTIAWADPEEEIVYIFLSNRIHPDQDNMKLIEEDVRTNIQQAVYEAIIQ